MSPAITCEVQAKRDDGEVRQRNAGYCPPHQAAALRRLPTSVFLRTSSSADRLLMVAPMGSGFLSLTFQRENVVG